MLSVLRLHTRVQTSKTRQSRLMNDEELRRGAQRTRVIRRGSNISNKYKQSKHGRALKQSHYAYSILVELCPCRHSMLTCVDTESAGCSIE